MEKSIIDTSRSSSRSEIFVAAQSSSIQDVDEGAKLQGSAHQRESSEQDQGYEDPLQVIQRLISQSEQSDDVFASRLEEEDKENEVCNKRSGEHSSIDLRASFVSALADEVAEWSLQKAQENFAGLKKQQAPPANV